MKNKVKIDLYGQYTIAQLKEVVSFFEKEENIDYNLPLHFVVERDYSNIFIGQDGNPQIVRLPLSK